MVIPKLVSVLVILVFSISPLYSDGFSHTGKYNKDGFVYFIF